MRAPPSPQMDLSVVRGINNAGPVGKHCRGNSVCISAPSHMANWSHRAWKSCRLMAIINSTKKLARGRHQTGSSSGSDCQQVCRALAVPWLVVKASRHFTAAFKETSILPQDPAAPICCSIPGTNGPHKCQIFPAGCPPQQKQPDKCLLAPIFPLLKWESCHSCWWQAQLTGWWSLLLQGGSLNIHANNPKALGTK